MGRYQVMTMPPQHSSPGAAAQKSAQGGSPPASGSIPQESAVQPHASLGDVSPDARFSSRATIRSGWIAGISAIIAAVIAVVLTLAFGPNTSSSSQGDVPLSVSIDHLPKNEISFPYQTLTGTVRGLKAGEMIWTFSQYPSSKNPNYASKFFPDTGPCVVNEAKHTWACNRMTIGDPGEVGVYRIWVSVVSDEEALMISQKITCADNATLPPSQVQGNPFNCDTSVSGYDPLNSR